MTVVCRCSPLLFMKPNCQYRNRNNEVVVLRIVLQIKLKPDVIQVMMWMRDAWNDVTIETIKPRNCWRHVVMLPAAKDPVLPVTDTVLDELKALFFFSFLESAILFGGSFACFLVGPAARSFGDASLFCFDHASLALCIFFYALNAAGDCKPGFQRKVP